MIKNCQKCGCSYNDETVNKCPLCYMDITKKIIDRRKKRKKNKPDKFKGIIGFIDDDCRDKRKTATGYQHKQKTGGNNN